MGRRIVERLIQLSHWLALQKFAAEQEKTEELTDYLKFNKYESDFPFPSDYDESHNDITVWKHQPETKTFTQALQTLMTDLRLGWKDLHPRNIMMGRDGNLKIIDVGL